MYTYKFEKMTKEECVKELSFATEELVREYTTSWNTVDYLHDKFPCFSKEEIEKAIIDYVKSKIKERMGDLKDKE